jgi:hydrogenase maturation factor
MANFLPIVLLLAVGAQQPTELRLETNQSTTSGPSQLQVSLTTGTESPTGIQFDLEFDNNAVEVKVLPGPVAQLAGKTVYTSTPASNKLRVIVIGFNQDVLTNGVVALVQVIARNGDTSPAGSLVRLTAPSATNRAGQSVSVTAPGSEITPSAPQPDKP